MTMSVAVLLVCPLLLLTLVVGTVVIVALCRAETKDVPAIWRDSVAVLSRLTDKMPTTTTSAQNDDRENEDPEESAERPEGIL